MIKFIDAACPEGGLMCAWLYCAGCTVIGTWLGWILTICFLAVWRTKEKLP